MELIVLHTTKVGETSMVLHTLSEAYGRRSFIVKGLGKKSVTALFLPMNILEVEVVESRKSTLWMIKNPNCAVPLNGIRNSLYKNTITMFLSEVLFRTIKDGMNEDGLYSWCRSSIMLLDALENDFSNFHLRFLLELTITLGFSPKYEDLMPFIIENRAILKSLMEASFAESMLIPMSGSMRNEMAEGLVRYIEYHSESSLNINSLKVLREIFL